MLKQLVYLIYLLLITSYSHAVSFGSCLEGTSAQHATRKYQPFNLMKAYAFAGQLGSYSGLQKWQTENESKKPQYSGVDTFMGVGSIIGLFTSLGGPSRNCPSNEVVTREQIDTELYKEYRKSFYLTYGVFAVSQVGMAASSKVDNRWVIASLGIASPFILDLIIRPLFYKHTLAPWESPSIQITAQHDSNGSIYPMLGWTTQF